MLETAYRAADKDFGCVKRMRSCPGLQKTETVVQSSDVFKGRFSTRLVFLRRRTKNPRLLRTPHVAGCRLTPSSAGLRRPPPAAPSPVGGRRGGLLPAQPASAPPLPLPARPQHRGPARSPAGRAAMGAARHYRRPLLLLLLLAAAWGPCFSGELRSPHRRWPVPYR